mgnify:CR=1 FL=1|jgi:hypothetical protein
MILTKSDNILYLVLIAILTISIIIKILCVYYFRCEEDEIKYKYYGI